MNNFDERNNGWQYSGSGNYGQYNPEQNNPQNGQPYNPQQNGGQYGQTYNPQHNGGQYGQYTQPSGQQYGQYAQPNSGQYNPQQNNAQPYNSQGGQYGAYNQPNQSCGQPYNGMQYNPTDYQRGFMDGQKSVMQQNKPAQRNIEKYDRVMDGFGKALTSCIFGFISFVFLTGSGLISLAFMLPLIIMGLIFGIKSIKLFSGRVKEGRVKPVPALVLGIVGVVMTSFAIMSAMLYMFS